MPVVPVWVGLGEAAVETDPVKILTRLLTHYISAPKSDMDVWVEEAISLRYTISAHEDSGPNVLIGHVQAELEGAVGRIFGEPPVVEVRASPHTSGTGYILQIEIQARYEGETHVLTESVVVIDGIITVSEPEETPLEAMTT